MRVAPHLDDGNRLRVLDACLHTLENAHEHNMLTVTPALADTLRAQVAGIQAGMAITDAIEVVLREQEPCLRWRRQQRRPIFSDGAGSQPRTLRSEHHLLRRDGWGEDAVAVSDHDAPLSSEPAGRHSDSRGGSDEASLSDHRSEMHPGGDSPADNQGLKPRVVTGGGGSLTPLDEHAARSLTERIKHAVENTCLLLLEAHNRRAWSALGYVTWEQYVREEFGLSRSRSYELLDHGRLIRTLEVAAGMSGIADISAFAARQLKPRLHEVAAEVRHRTANAPQEQVADIVAKVIGEERAKLSGLRSADDPARDGEARRSRHDSDLTSLCGAIHTLAQMPPVEATLARIPADQRWRLGPVDGAVAWLTELAGELRTPTRRG